MAEEFEEWLHTLLARPANSRIAAKLTQVIARQPERASYASATEMAALADINATGVTRSAQALGYTGWPDLRAELRARYLTSLSMAEIASRHSGESGAAVAGERSHQADQRALATGASPLRSPTFPAVVDLLAQARARIAFGAGSYSTVASLLATNASLAGYLTTYVSEGSSTANRLAHLGPDDVLVVVSFWRIGRGALNAAQFARSTGATVCVITDHAPSRLADQAHHVLKVTAEGGAHFPTMVPAVALVNALATELAAVDPSRTRRAIATAEKSWNAMESFID